MQKGENFMQGLSEKRYDPQKTDTHWYQVWVERGYFHADVQAPGESFCIVIPPPNITAFLHMGHALNTTLQDILVRWKRMDGYNTLWLPGTDHAGLPRNRLLSSNWRVRGHIYMRMVVSSLSSASGGGGKSLGARLSASSCVWERRVTGTMRLHDGRRPIARSS
jgi:valyl-tRNA synthetase